MIASVFFFCVFFVLFFFFFKQKTAYEIVSRDWSSDVCSSDLGFSVADSNQSIIAVSVSGLSDWIKLCTQARF